MGRRKTLTEGQACLGTILTSARANLILLSHPHKQINIFLQNFLLWTGLYLMGLILILASLHNCFRIQLVAEATCALPVSLCEECIYL